MASMSVPCPKISAASRVGSVVAGSSRQQPKPKKISFPQAQNWGFSASQSLNKNKSAVWKRYSQLGQVSTGNSAVDAKAEPEPLNGKVEAVESDGLDAPTLSAFMAQVSDLVKLVDSRDIVELELKQLDCELIIRKKEALQQQAAAAAPFMQMPQPPMHFQQFQPAAPPASAAPVAPSAPAAPAKTSQPSPSPSSSHPPFKCPMAGTFYRSPAPGEPPFVKVGDKVQKGQVVCIIEAMKLMNEIEADQSGTVVEIVAEDGKPVSIDSPLFIIVP